MWGTVYSRAPWTGHDSEGSTERVFEYGDQTKFTTSAMFLLIRGPSFGTILRTGKKIITHRKCTNRYIPDFELYIVQKKLILGKKIYLAKI